MKYFHESKQLELYSADISSELSLPYMSAGVSAGFPSPAEDFLEETIDLNKEVIKNPSATFYAKVKGVSMIDAGIYPEDILVIDKSLNVEDEDIVVSYIDGEFVLKRIKVDKSTGKVFLLPENHHYQPIEITEENHFLVWGVVTYIFKKARRNVRSRRL
ncbi:translesion error-prone DNA polymerase V autoproteolytic subunit [Emticicia sediminis]